MRVGYRGQRRTRVCLTTQGPTAPCEGSGPCPLELLGTRGSFRGSPSRTPPPQRQVSLWWPHDQGPLLHTHVLWGQGGPLPHGLAGPQDLLAEYRGLGHLGGHTKHTTLPSWQAVCRRDPPVTKNSREWRRQGPRARTVGAHEDLE